MKKLITLMFVAFLLPAGQVFAGAGHSHGPDGGHSMGPISDKQVIERGLDVVKKLVNKGKIDATWSEVKTANAQQKTFSKGPEWVVSLVNKKVSDASKQTLYLFFTLDGHYIAANYDGN